MSETTKRAMLLSPFDNPSWRSATDAERAEWFRLHSNAAPRPSTLSADGSAERETTNSPSEIGTGCTGRKSAFLTVAFVTLNVASLVTLVASLGLLFGFLAWAVSVLGGCLFAEFWIVRPSAARRRASGGDRR